MANENETRDKDCTPEDPYCLLRSQYPLPWPDKNTLPIIAINPLPKNLHLFVHNNLDAYPEKVVELVRSALSTVEECGCNTVMAGGTFQQMDAVIWAIIDKMKPKLQRTELNLNVILNPAYLYLAPCCTRSILVHYGASPKFWNSPFDNVKNDADYDHFEGEEKIVAWQVMDQPKYWDWGNTAAEEEGATATGEEHEWNRLTMGYGMTSSMDHWPIKDPEGNYKPSDDIKRLSLFNLAVVPDKKAGMDTETLKVIKEWIGSYDTYEEYLTVLDRLFKPRVWSYDFYPFRNIVNNGIIQTDEKGKEKIEVRKDEFFRYLKLFRDITTRDKSYYMGTESFWTYGMTIGHCMVDSSGKILWSQPAPTVGMLRYEVFNALACGARGIVYWQYGMWETDSPSVDHLVYTQAPLSCEITGEGNNAQLILTKSSIWYALKQVNEEIKSWKSIFLSARVKKLFYFSGSNINLKESIADEDNIDIFPADGYGIVSSIQLLPISDGILISHMQTENAQADNYLIFVNQDYKAKKTLKVSLKSGINGEFLTPALSPEKPIDPVEPIQPIEPETPEKPVGSSEIAITSDEGPETIPGIGVSKVITTQLEPGGIAVLNWKSLSGIKPSPDPVNPDPVKSA